MVGIWRGRILLGHDDGYDDTDDDEEWENCLWVHGEDAVLKNKPQTAPKQGRNIKRILIDDFDYRQYDYDDRHDDCDDHGDDGRQWKWDWLL